MGSPEANGWEMLRQIELLCRQLLSKQIKAHNGASSVCVACNISFYHKELFIDSLTHSVNDKLMKW